VWEDASRAVIADSELSRHRERWLLFRRDMGSATPQAMNLTGDPIPGLIRRIAMPASIGFFFNTMFNVVDTFYAGKISTHAQAGLALSFPVFFIILGMGSGISQGATALMSNALGARDRDKAQLYSLQAVSFGFLFSLVLTLAGLTFSPFLFGVLGAKDAYLDIALEYMNMILLGTVFFLFQSILNATLTSQGDTRTFRDVLIGGFVLNLILDPWFLYGGLGVPAMGVKGIALATVVLQFGGGLFMLHRVRKSHLWDSVNFGYLIPRRSIFKDIAMQGFPASLNMVTVALGIFVITWFISRFSTEGVAAYGIATRVEQIALLPTIGLNMATLTLVGQNNGAGRRDRVRETWLTSMRYGLLMMAGAGVLILLFAGPLMEVFTKDEPVIRHGTAYLRIAAITLCSYVILYQTVFMLQGLKRPMYAVWVGLYRQIVGPMIVFYVLAYGMGWGLAGVWWGIFLVTWTGALAILMLSRRMLRSP